VGHRAARFQSFKVSKFQGFRVSRFQSFKVKGKVKSEIAGRWRVLLPTLYLPIRSVTMGCVSAERPIPPEASES
jgi:hypothetical protein